MSCLFNSLARFVGEPSAVVRQKICDYLAAGKPIIEGLDTRTILAYEYEGRDYVQRMRRPSTWGGAIEIQAACNLWGYRVVVHNHRTAARTQIEFLPVSLNSPTRTVHLSWTGGHYEAMSTETR